MYKRLGGYLLGAVCLGAAATSYALSLWGSLVVILPPTVDPLVVGYLRQIGYVVITVSPVQWLFTGLMLGFAVLGVLQLAEVMRRRD